MGYPDLALEADPEERFSLWFVSVVTTFIPIYLLQDCYILDQSGTKIYVWKGRGATKVEKQMAMSKALVGATVTQCCSKKILSVTPQICSESHTRH